MIPEYEIVKPLLDGKCMELPYTRFCYEFNLTHILADIEAKRMPKPQSEEDWLDAFVNEFCANVAAAVQGIRDDRLR